MGNPNSSLAPGTVLIEDVSKRFRKHTLRHKGYTTLKTSLVQKLFSSRFPKDNYLQALAELSVVVEPGSALGVIGRNGSGKSTLLKLIAGIYQPDKGRVHVEGKVSALIELGAGFHPDFTGRENVYLGGVMYGLTKKEIDALFDDIVAYAELEDFIDDPVRTYSSGMYMRLGFSLAVHTDPDILLIDEVLAVGDAAFIHRCNETISEFKRRGKTLLFVTHDLTAVGKWCDEVIWLNKGVVKERGEPRFVIDRYLGHITAEEEKELERQRGDRDGSSSSKTDYSLAAQAARKGSPERWGTREIEITNVVLSDAHGKEKWVFDEEEQLQATIFYKINKPSDDVVFGVGIVRADGVEVFGTNTELQKLDVPIAKSDAGGTEGSFSFIIERLSLLENSYYFDVAVHREDGFPFDYHHRQYKFSVRGNSRAQGVFLPAHRWQFQPR